MGNLIRVIDNQTTNGAVIVSSGNYIVPLNMGADIICKVVGKDSLNNICSFTKIITVQNLSGVLTIIGGTSVNSHKGILSGTSILEGIVGTTVSMNITGMVGKTISWHIVFEIQII